MRLLLLLALLQAAPDAGPEEAPAAEAAPDGGSAPAKRVVTPEEAARTRKLLAEERARLNLLLDRKQSVLDALDTASHAVSQAEAQARAAAEEERAARARLEQATAEAQSAEAALKARIGALRPRLLARYRLGRGGAAALLLSSESIADLLWRQRTLNAVLESDLVLLRAAKEDRERLAHARQAQAEREAEHAERAKALAAELAEARHKRDQLSALLSAVDAQRAAREKTLAELAQAAARLEVLAAPAGPAGYSGKVSFEKLKGRLPYPTAGVVEVKFGKVVDPRHNTAVVQKGIDLRAPEGAEVKVVAPGRVAHAGWLRGYGNLMLVDHGAGFFSLYAHLAGLERKAGEELQAGDRIGVVGDTGSLKGAYLYFEIRHHGTPLNPAGWLKK